MIKPEELLYGQEGVRLIDYRTTNNEPIYSSPSASDDRRVVNILLPTVYPDVAYEKFLQGLHNMTEISSISTILINFQGSWVPESMSDFTRECEELGFAVIYTYNKYVINPNVPFNLIMEDTAQLGKSTNCRIILSMDDDLEVRAKSPTIGKSGGRQYLEIIHYMMHNPKCGIVSCTGTIGKIPPRNYLGPHRKRDVDLFLTTGLGLFVRNHSPELGVVVPLDCTPLYGAIGDAMAGVYRLGAGLYHAKYNHVRAVHPVATVLTKNEDGLEEGDWSKHSLIRDNNEKYIRENYYEKFNSARIQGCRYIDYQLYLDRGGIDMWNNQDLYDEYTTFYTQDEEDMKSNDQLISELLEVPREPK